MPIIFAVALIIFRGIRSGPVALFGLTDFVIVFMSSKKFLIFTILGWFAYFFYNFKSTVVSFKSGFKGFTK